MSGIDISGILDQVNAATQGVSETTSSAASTIAANNTALTDSYTESEVRAKNTADATGLVQSVHNFGQLAAQDAIQKFAAQVGADSEDSTGLQHSLTQTFLDASNKRNQADATIAQKRSINFMDDPLGWIMNKVTINDDINQRNAYNEQANDAEDQIAATNRLVDARASAIAKTQTTTSTAAAQAGATIAANNAMEVASNLNRQGLVANTAGVKEISDLDYRQLSIATNRLDANAKYLQIQNDQSRLSIAQQSLSLEQERTRLATLKESEATAANDYVTASIKRGMQALYPNNPKAWDIDPGKYTAMMTGKVPMDPKLLYAYTIGSTNNQLNPQGDKRILATSPVQMAQVLLYKPDLSPDAKTTAALIDKAVTTVHSDNNYKQLIAAKDTKGIEDAINTTAQQLLDASVNHTNDPTSMYYLPPADIISKNIPALQNSQLYQKVLTPLIAAKVDLSDPNAVTGYAVAAIKEGKINTNDAADGIATMYAQGQAANIASKQIAAMGLVPTQKYISNATGGGSLGGIGDIDYADKIAVQRNIMRRLSSTFVNYSDIGRIFD